MMSAEQIVQNAILQFYTRKEGVLMSPTFGVAARIGNSAYALTVAHTIEDRESVEIWNGLHSEQAKSYGMKTAAAKICEFNISSSTKIVLGREVDLLAVRLDNYKERALTGLTRHISLLQPILIAFLDYEPENNVLHARLDGIAGLVSRVTETHIIVSAFGCEGMSGAPVFSRRDSEYLLVGIYTGTPRFTPLTKRSVVNFANVVKTSSFPEKVRNSL